MSDESFGPSFWDQLLLLFSFLFPNCIAIFYVFCSFLSGSFSRTVKTSLVRCELYYGIDFYSNAC